MQFWESVAVLVATGGVYLLITNEHSSRQIQIGKWRVSLVRLTGFAVAVFGFLLLLGWASAEPAWWSSVEENRSEEIPSWIQEPGRMAIFWFLAATCIASALRVVTAKTQSDWLAACLVFSIAVAVLFALLRNYWAVGFCLPIIVGVGWSRKELANQSEPTSGQKMEETVAEPLLVSTASVALAWLLAVSIHWTVTEEASPDRIRTTQRALPRVALANETTVEETDTPIAASTTNEGWLITISVLFMALSCQLALSAEIKHERQGSNT